MAEDTRPWEAGEHADRWVGYLDPRTIDPEAPRVGVLRNIPGIQDFDELRAAEDAAVEYRTASLPQVDLPESYGLDRLQVIHHHLFQDVYEWAGQVRTVNIAKGRTAFDPVEELPERLARVADFVRAEGGFAGAPLEDFAHGLAHVYNEVNQAHPFREGNGRTQRLLLDQLAAESGRTLEWPQVQGWLNDRVCDEARVTGYLGHMSKMIRRMTNEDPADKVPDRVAEARALLDRARSLPASPHTRESGPKTPDRHHQPPETRSREEPGHER